MSLTTNKRRWLAALLFVLGCAVLASLGAWQLSRAAQKRVRYEAYLARLDAPVVRLDDLPSSEILVRHAWQRVKLYGHYRDIHVLLDNRVQDGKVGYDVLTPFVTEAGRTVLIERGWIALGGSRDSVPDLVAPADQFTLQGYVSDVPIVGVELNERSTDAEWLAPHIVRVQRVELDGLTSLLGAPLWPAVVYLDPGQPAALTVQRAIPGDGSARHQAYAVQWFAMAVVLAVIGIARWRKQRTET